MILVDTSIWADHLNRTDDHLVALNCDKMTMMHPFVIGELAAGNLHPWERSLAALRLLPTAPVVDDNAFYGFIFACGLMGTGLSFVDLHLLASAMSSESLLWSRDKRLDEAAVQLKCQYVRA